MYRHLTPLDGTPINGTPRRPRAARPLTWSTTVPAERTSAAMDDAAEAERLIADLLALVDAGLVAPVEEDGEIRYAPADDPDDAEAA